MASLKDMRVRIASTKATQKITKAMQMVAASKLRRAQVAAEAARPFAERMDRVLGNIAAGVAGSDSAPRLLAGTGTDKPKATDTLKINYRLSKTDSTRLDSTRKRGRPALTALKI
jgi:ATP synthase F1 gamma subunit